MTVKELLEKMPDNEFRLRDYTSGSVIPHTKNANFRISRYWDFEVVKFYARTHTWNGKTEAQIVIMIRAEADGADDE